MDEHLLEEVRCLVDLALEADTTEDKDVLLERMKNILKKEK